MSIKATQHIFKKNRKKPPVIYVRVKAYHLGLLKHSDAKKSSIVTWEQSKMFHYQSWEDVSDPIDMYLIQLICI